MEESKELYFDDDELEMLKAIFHGAEGVINTFNDTYKSNVLYSIKCKLGIYDIVK